MDEVIIEQVTKRNATIQKKDLKGMGIQPRLQGLQSKGVLVVTQQLSNKLREIKFKEREAAKSSVEKAAAQRRIILPDFEDRVVRSLVHWTYCQGSLSYDDAEHLYVFSFTACNRLIVSGIIWRFIKVVPDAQQG